ncbi:uncharacterized protein LOC117649373 isoform X2 [Thrips palmi]|uniref:Uncharacterized protein LOC117649373 isoform X2 n=1 Tax=Thrips palmi TaxID=161013 RepID=A0A6P8ZS88_THRPL|nr:uncharacterized protein LOC117649373 isoform X2 [Thrips palmi]
MRFCLFSGLLISTCALYVLSAQRGKPVKTTRLFPKWYGAQTCTDKKHYANLTNYRIELNEYGAEYIADAEWWLYRGIKVLTKLSDREMSEARVYQELR